MDFQYLYKKFNKRTPFSSDCGQLCNNACCVDSSGEELGMYLFPGEETMFLNKDNFKISDSEFQYGNYKAKILLCSPYCKRKERPLSCRIFPLFPYIAKDGYLKVIVDPRGMGVCPLNKLEVKNFNSKFTRGVKHIGMELMKDKENYKFLYELSRLIDDEIEEIINLHSCFSK